MGVHIRLDIPEMMQKEVEKYSDIKLIYGKQLDLMMSLRIFSTNALNSPPASQMSGN
jgi:hypothetical protein